jgi:hypothetical protein
MVDTELLHLQPLVMSHFHFPTILEQAAYPSIDSKSKKDVEMDACQWFQMLQPSSYLNSILNYYTIISNLLPR